jgi:hypothetical protein
LSRACRGRIDPAVITPDHERRPKHLLDDGEPVRELLPA